MAPTTVSQHVVVAGDVVTDRHLYAGERHSLTARDRRGVYEISERGGAHLLARLHDALLPSRPGEFHPEPLTDPDLTLSRHPARATERRLPPPVENWSSSCCQLAHSQRR